MVSVVIPSRNEPYLSKTIKDILDKASGLIEVIAILDGYWPDKEDLIDDKRVHYIHFGSAVGMRGAINAGVSLAKGKYIMKSDAHCLFRNGFDQVLKEDSGINTILIPRRHRLDPEKWEIIRDGRPPIDRMFLSPDLHGRDWKEGNHEKDLLEETPSSQGSCWFMEKEYYKFLEILDADTYGTFFSEFQEIGLKCWLSGGRILVDKGTFYAHWHKTKGRGYSLPREDQEKATKAVEKWKHGNAWHRQIYPLSWLFDKFDMPNRLR